MIFPDEMPKTRLIIRKMIKPLGFVFYTGPG